MQGEERWTNFLVRDDGNRVALARFVDVTNLELFSAWVDASKHWIEDVGGERIYAGDLDVVQGRSALSFSHLLLEEYSSRRAAVEVLARATSNIEMGIRDVLILALTPDSRSSHRISSIVGRLVRTFSPVQVVEVPEEKLPQDSRSMGISSDAAQLSVFYDHDQWQPFTMVNLNGIRETASYEKTASAPGEGSQTGKKAYERYARNTAIEVYRRGGNFYWVATPMTVLLGDSDHPLGQHWSQLVLVGWPSRMALRHLIRSRNFSRGVVHRNASLSRAIAIPGTPWPEFSRYSI
jgi:uncharacterized protein (DUF1330 family)